MTTSLTTTMSAIIRTMYGKSFMVCIASLLLPTQPQIARSDSPKIEPIEAWGDGRKIWLLLLLTSMSFLFFGSRLR